MFICFFIWGLETLLHGEKLWSHDSWGWSVSEEKDPQLSIIITMLWFEHET